jgi:hypothetical protein
MASIRNVYTRRRAGGSLLSKFWTKKLSDKEKAWKSHIESRSPFMKDLKNQVAKREKVCGDALSKKVDPIMKKLKKSMKLAEVTKFVRDLDNLIEIIKKWDERVISYATDLGKTCGMFDVVEKKSDILVFISKRISYEHEKDPDMYSWEVRPVLKPGVAVSEPAPVKDGRLRDAFGRFLKKPDLTRKDRDDVRKIFNRRVIDTRAEDRIKELKARAKGEKSLRWRPHYWDDDRKLTSPDRRWVTGEVGKYGMYTDTPRRHPLDKRLDPRYYPKGPGAAKTDKRFDPRYYPTGPGAAKKGLWKKPRGSDESIMKIIRKEKEGADKKRIEEIRRAEREKIRDRAEKRIADRPLEPEPPVPPVPPIPPATKPPVPPVPPATKPPVPPVPPVAPSEVAPSEVAPAEEDDRTIPPAPKPPVPPEPETTEPEKPKGFISSVKDFFGKKKEKDDKAPGEDADPVERPAPAPPVIPEPVVEPKIDPDIRPRTPVAVPVDLPPEAPAPPPAPVVPHGLSRPELMTGPTVSVEDHIEAVGEGTVLEVDNDRSIGKSPYSRKTPSDTVIHIKKPIIQGAVTNPNRINIERDRALQVKGAKEMMDKNRVRNAVKDSEILETILEAERDRNDTVAEMLEESGTQADQQKQEELDIEKAKVKSFENVREELVNKNILTRPPFPKVARDEVPPAEEVDRSSPPAPLATDDDLLQQGAEDLTKMRKHPVPEETDWDPVSLNLNAQLKKDGKDEFTPV